MPSNILIGILFVFLLIGVTQQQEPTLLTYYVEYEEDQDDDYIEATLHIEAESTSLSGAIADAKEAADKVISYGQKYCKDF